MLVDNVLGDRFKLNMRVHVMFRVLYIFNLVNISCSCHIYNHVCIRTTHGQ